MQLDSFLMLVSAFGGLLIISAILFNNKLGNKVINEIIIKEKGNVPEMKVKLTSGMYALTAGIILIAISVFTINFNYKKMYEKLESGQTTKEQADNILDEIKNITNEKFKEEYNNASWTISYQLELYDKSGDVKNIYNDSMFIPNLDFSFRPKKTTQEIDYTNSNNNSKCINILNVDLWTIETMTRVLLDYKVKNNTGNIDKGTTSFPLSLSCEDYDIDSKNKIIRLKEPVRLDINTY